MSGYLTIVVPDTHLLCDGFMRKAIAYLQQRTLPLSVAKSIPDGPDIPVVFRGKMTNRASGGSERINR